MPTQHFHYLKSGCLLFWACWFTVASSTNVCDFLYVLNLLPSDWAFRSGNYIMLGNVLTIYHTPPLFLHGLFICDISVQVLAALLFWIAAIQFWSGRDALRWIIAAFTLSIALWGVFLVMEEIFIAYRFESVHSELFVFELISLLAIRVL